MGFLKHELARGLVFIGNNTIEDGVLDSHLDGAHFSARGEVERLHNLFAHDGWLEIADAVAFFEFHHLLPYELVVGAESAHFLLVFGRDVGITENHEVVDIIACLKKQTTYS